MNENIPYSPNWKPWLDLACEVAIRKLRTVGPDQEITDEFLEQAFRLGRDELLRCFGTEQNRVGTLRAASGMAHGAAAQSYVQSMQRLFERTEQYLRDALLAFQLEHNAWVTDRAARRESGSLQTGSPENNGGEDYRGYASADTIWHDHGIAPPRLSEAKQAGKIRSKKAPPGILTTDGRPVRLLYHVEDAKKYALPKYLQGTDPSE